MKIDRREFLKTAAVMGMLLPITEVYGSVSQRHVHVALRNRGLIV